MGCAHSLHHWSSLWTTQRRGLAASAAAEGSVLWRAVSASTVLERYGAVDLIVVQSGESSKSGGEYRR